MNKNLAAILGIEWLIAAQGVELRDIPTSPILSNAITALRAHVPALGNDRYMAPDLDAAAMLTRRGALITAAGDIELPIWLENRG